MPLAGTAKIITFDLAANTGYAMGQIEKLPTFSSHRFDSTGNDFGKHQWNVRTFLNEVLAAESPTMVGYEQPSLFGLTTPATVIKLCSYVSTLEELCFRKGIPVRQINPATLKKFFTGNGRAKKDEMERRARALGFKVKNDDEADAVAMWFYMVDCYGTDEHKQRFVQLAYECDMGRQQRMVL